MQIIDKVTVHRLTLILCFWFCAPLLCLRKTRSSATAEKQRVSCACLPTLSQKRDPDVIDCNFEKD